jgi:hypothetical protein
VFPFATLHPNAGAQLRAEINLLPSNMYPMFGGANIMTKDDANPSNISGAESFVQNSDDFMYSADAGHDAADPVT